jgi:peptide-methionine (S)-S-oxide reductase
VSTNYCRSSGSRTIQPRACARATTSERKYRSCIYWHDESQRAAAERSAAAYGASLQPRASASHDRDSQGTDFYYAEDYHQQYLAKNPGGYCGLGGTGVSCPIGVGVESTG